MPSACLPEVEAGTPSRCDCEISVAGPLSIWLASEATSGPFRFTGWVREQLECWITAAGIDEGRIFRRVDRSGQVRGDHISVKAIWHIVKKSARRAGLPNVAPHDLRRTCARLCQSAGGELEQIQFLLGHVSIQTTERYLGSKQRLHCAVNDRIGIEPSS
jgi:integrase